MATAYTRLRADVQSSILICPFYTALLGVKIMDHMPILKLNQLNLLSCCYLFIIMVFHVIKKSFLVGKFAIFLLFFGHKFPIF